MSYANRGKPLERALVGGARHYRRHQGRKVVLVQQHTPMHQTVDGGLAHSAAGAPVDLIGGLNGIPWAVEAKETSLDRFPLEDRKASQRAALRVLHDCCFIVAMAIDFTARREVYLVPWWAVAAFEAAPWRRSLSLEWCRVNGLLLPELRRDSEHDRATLFLDGAPHPDWAEALKRVEADQQSHGVITPELKLEADDARDLRPGKRQLARRERLAARPDPRDRAAYQEYMRALVGESIDRQLGAAARKPKFGRGRRG